MTDLIAIIVIAVVLSLAVGYIIKTKKKGIKCIGCPLGANCPSSKKGNCSCGCTDEDK